MRCAARQSGGAVPRLLVTTGRSRVARVSKRTAERTLSRGPQGRCWRSLQARCHIRPAGWDSGAATHHAVRPALVAAGNQAGDRAHRGGTAFVLSFEAPGLHMASDLGALLADLAELREDMRGRVPGQSADFDRCFVVSPALPWCFARHSGCPKRPLRACLAARLELWQLTCSGEILKMAGFISPGPNGLAQRQHLPRDLPLGEGNLYASPPCPSAQRPNAPASTQLQVSRTQSLLRQRLTLRAIGRRLAVLFGAAVAVAWLY